MRADVDKIVLRYTTEEAGAGGKSYDSQQTLRSIGEAVQGVENLLRNPRTLKIVLDSGPSMPRRKPPVKVQRLEWEQDETYPKGERWVGQVNGKQVATVTHFSASYGGKVNYHVDLGPLSSPYGGVASVAAGKRAAQAALTKAVRSLTA
ncbi:hypothetical protein [Streptomyces sp. NPDC002088]|uniref:hypothetical protein n=1 Tax=Streptomyces sp. NPDC002088 TaxID=3154665 RepID=UPI003331BA26